MTITPDAHGAGLAARPLDALRYDGHTDDPLECAGILRAFMPANAKVLDVGCGTGSVSLIANRDKNNAVFGIEPDADRTAVARSRGLDVTCGYLSTGYLEEHGPFDVVMFADVLEHLASPAEMLALARSGLKPGGLILISVPNAVHWIMRWQILFGRFEYADCGIRDATHLRWFTRSSMTHLLDYAGFETVEVRYSAGAGCPEYFQWRPWRWAKISLRSRFVRLMARWFPSLFGCQLLIKARKK
ncbi:MAG TPA: class I SAM-dependent methyltransferase [Opitutaceae bacterium]|nr:class I SAM-dependent methyltransferase [Opitutaceae bacterium]